jgi:hypothetical protein
LDAAPLRALTPPPVLQLLDEAEKFITGFAHSAESGFVRRQAALNWIGAYKGMERVPGPNDPVIVPGQALTEYANGLLKRCQDQQRENAKLQKRVEVIRANAADVIVQRDALQAQLDRLEKTQPLCPHGMPRVENTCGPCSQGQPNRSTDLDPEKLSTEDLWALADRMGAELVKRGQLRKAGA